MLEFLREAWVAVIAAVMFVVVLIALAVYGANVEARVFNRVTGQNITTWEALWTNLRVDCN